MCSLAFWLLRPSTGVRTFLDSWGTTNPRMALGANGTLAPAAAAWPTQLPNCLRILMRDVSAQAANR